MYLYQDSLANHTFMDIAITDSYVLATSEHILFGGSPYAIPSAYLWWFDKPHVPNSNMFDVEIRRYRFPGRSSFGPVVEQYGGNQFAVAYNKENFNIVVDDFNGITANHRLAIPVTGDVTPKEMKLNTYNQEIDILIDVSYSPSIPIPITPSYCFLHIPLPMLTTGGSLNAHTYQSQAISSFDYIHASECFIASGKSYQTASPLKLYKYKYNFWGICPDPRLFTSEHEIIKSIPFDQDGYTLEKYFWRKTMQTHTGSSIVTLDCESNENKNK